MLKQEIRTDRAPAAIGPYSQGIVSSPLVVTSGQLPLDPDTGDMVEGGIEAQAHQALRNLSALLESQGAGMQYVIKTTVFLKNMADFAAFNRVYAEYFQSPYPARSCVAVTALPKDALVEVEAIAVAP